MDTAIELHPKNDGETHVNLYSKGQTRLGRLGSNHSDIHIEHPLYGHFRTLEGLWYWLRTGKQHDMLRVMSGYNARMQGKELEKVWNPDFNREFKMGIVAKVKASEELRQLLRESSLPFVHYYYYGKGDEKKVIVPKGHEWQMLFWERMRDTVKKDRCFDEIIESLKVKTPA